MESLDHQQIEKAAEEARKTLEKMVSDVRSARGADDKFFPRGIELIDVEISIGAKATPLFSIHAKIAGPDAEKATADEAAPA